jgi:hypothetical protein
MAKPCWNKFLVLFDRIFGLLADPFFCEDNSFLNCVFYFIKYISEKLFLCRSKFVVIEFQRIEIRFNFSFRLIAQVVSGKMFRHGYIARVSTRVFFPFISDILIWGSKRRK